VILVWGPADDPPTQRVLEVLRVRQLPLLHLDEAALDTLHHDITLNGGVHGWLQTPTQRVLLRSLRAIYLRPGEARSPAAMAASAALLGLAAATQATVVNRPAAGRSNGSKPYQASLLASAGLAVPETLVTTDPKLALAFLAAQRHVVYKSISGVRSIVARLDAERPADVARLAGVAHGPVQLQRWVPGHDLRVHVVGTRCFTTEIFCEAADYRYAARQGAEVSFAAANLPSALADQLVGLTRRLGLLVSGIDLRRDPDGRWFGLEVNPSPGFSFYEEATGQPIAEAIVNLLAGGE
jgi:glutathione synthase/RimK-type ligase-like ATP-grasp enzyme